ncbi:P-loop containing nucleoside triphosphate hydrolase protein [Poronia punctata]|nr:P-loop containing nucleoside triphosphate hydrolase protein [Poronia punctata]
METGTEHKVKLDATALDNLSSATSSALLDTIDGIRELGIGELVNLPQIIVVGDQSSGKSSVLEAISGLRFPTKGDVCTRFATELVIRRAPEMRIDVRINSATGSASRQFHRSIFNADSLPEIIDEATGVMGLDTSDTEGFSRDVLHVEIAGPGLPSLTLIDLPGFFHSSTAEQTSEDQQIVNQLAGRYMSQPNSIILVVVAANNNLANQIVLKEVKKYDPDRKRTIGVITKPDLAGTGSQNEKKMLELIRGQESAHRLNLGWYVIRNRPEGRERMSMEERDAEEKEFFRDDIWSDISDSCGIVHLRKKLSETLPKHIQRTLPGLVSEMETGLSVRQQALRKLGKDRSNAEDLRIYLHDIAEEFQRLLREGIEGRYGAEFYGPKNRKLRALLRGTHNAFHITLVNKGIDRLIEWEDEARISSIKNIGWTCDEDNVPRHLHSFLQPFEDFPMPTTISEQDLAEELEEVAASNQGGDLYIHLFKRQIRPWMGIAEFYLERISSVAEAFIDELLRHVIEGDEQTYEAIATAYLTPFFASKRKLLKLKLMEILRPYEDENGPALDLELHERLLPITRKREATRTACFLQGRFPSLFTDKHDPPITREKVEEKWNGEDMVQESRLVAEKALDIAMLYFTMSLGTFAQNVVCLAAGNCLISDLYNILTPAMVVRMDEQRLRELASESVSIGDRRQALQREINILQLGLERCDRHRLNTMKTELPIRPLDGTDD